MRKCFLKPAIELSFIKSDTVERQKKIVEYLKSNQRITTNRCAKLLNISNDTSLRELKKLKPLNIIDKKGIGEATYYILKMR